ncbi:MAG: c-type cytochrome, partial [Spirochaetia bacterium]|nr:c-type cytochrome [Spirochaetia bacterium]
YYIVQGEFYTKGPYGQEGVQPFDMQKALDERPPYVVFNGAVGSMTGKNALTAKVGETIRMFVGNGGPSLISSFHVIGEVFDRVYTEGGTEANQKNVQSTLVPAGGSAIVEFKLNVPGNLVIVDHSIFRTFNKGALGMVKVEGEQTALAKEIYSGKIRDDVLLPEGSAIQEVPGSDKSRGVIHQTKTEKLVSGERLFAANCLACHQAKGEGIPGVFPPLAVSDYLKKGKLPVIQAVVKGLEGAMVVNGSKYEGVMPSVRLNDSEVASVLTYVYNNWGNDGTEVNVEDVAAARPR